MKKSYGEGVATRAGPESCIAAREGGGEALIGVCAGQVFSRENHAPPQGGLLRGADAVEKSGRPHWARRQRETRSDPARSETLCMHWNTLSGNREVPHLSATDEGADRIGKSKDERR
jgi:hypothetical protein